MCRSCENIATNILLTKATVHTPAQSARCTDTGDTEIDLMLTDTCVTATTGEWGGGGGGGGAGTIIDTQLLYLVYK